MDLKTLKLLIVEDSEDDALLLERQLRKGGYIPSMKRVTTRVEIEKALRDTEWDLVISDHNLPGLSSGMVLDIVQQSGIDIPFIIVSGSIGEELAVTAMKTGAHDYIMKNNLTRLVPAIERELRENENRKAHRRAQEVIEYLAYHDPLTGLSNRHEFEFRINRLLTDPEFFQQEHILLYIDLDQFKIINDTCGHLAGDELLKQLAARLKDTIGEQDTLSRLGGDEFGVLLPDCSLERANRVSATMLEIIKSFRFNWESKSFTVGASIGMVQFNGKTFREMTSVLSAADMACYAAKDLGRNRVHVYNIDEANILRRQGEMQWVSRINLALEENRLVLFQQTIKPVNQNVPDNIEFLVRMVDQDGELILPGAFIPAAERYNLMTQIDFWVIRNAFRAFAEMIQEGDDPGLIFINLSGSSLSEDGIFNFMREHVEATGIDPQRVCLEITETAAISNLGVAVSFMHEMKKLGFRFALDDFGAGLSSFTYLKTIPVDYIKVDGSFIRDMLDDEMDAAIVSAIHRVAHVAGLGTIAEFVESEAILARLQELGFDMAQGYAIHRPEPCKYTSMRHSHHHKWVAI